MDSTQNRLALLENAVADLAATSADRHREAAAHQNTLQALVDQQKILITALDQLLDKRREEENVDNQATVDEASKLRRASLVKQAKYVENMDSNVEESAKEVNVKPQIETVEELTISGYVNWEQTHNTILKHSYVPLKEFNDSIWLCLTSSKFDSSAQFLKILNSPHKVDKTTRFPSDGTHLNINLPAIQFYLQQAANDHTKLKDALRKVRPVIDNIIHNGLDGIHNEMSFEEKYNLVWVDLIKQTEEKQDNKIEKVLDMQHKQLKCAESLNVQLEKLNYTMSRIEPSVDNTMKDNGLEESSQESCYLNWSDCTNNYEPLDQQLYVQLDSLKNTFTSIMNEPNFTEPLQNMLAERRITWTSAVTVNEKKRFPTSGTYVNVNSLICKSQINIIFNALNYELLMYNSGTGVRKNSTPFYVTNAINVLLNMFKGDLKNSSIAHDLETFEEKYKLKWYNNS